VDKAKKEVTGFLAYVIAARELRATNAHRKCLIQYYASNAGNNGTFYKSMLDICAETCLSERFVQTANAAWKDAGVLSWTQGSNLSGKANTYQLQLKKLQDAARTSRKNVDAAKDAKRLRDRDRQARHRSTKEHKTTLLEGFVTAPHAVTA
jgi:hypothetical protein